MRKRKKINFLVLKRKYLHYAHCIFKHRCCPAIKYACTVKNKMKKKLQLDDFIMLKLCQQNDDILCTYVIIFVIIISVKCAILMMIVMIMCTCF